MTKTKKILFVCLTIVVLIFTTCIAPLAYTYDDNGVTPSVSTYTFNKGYISPGPGLPETTPNYYFLDISTIAHRPLLTGMFEIFIGRSFDEAPNWTFAYVNLPNYTITYQFEPSASKPGSTIEKYNLFNFSVTSSAYVSDERVISIRIDNIVNYSNNIMAEALYGAIPVTLRYTEYPTPDGYNDVIRYLTTQKQNTINSLTDTNRLLSSNLEQAYDRLNDAELELENKTERIENLQNRVTTLTQQLDQGNWLFAMFDGFGSAITNFISTIAQWGVGGVTLMSVFVVAVVAIVLYFVIKVVRA